MTKEQSQRTTAWYLERFGLPTVFCLIFLGMTATAMRWTATELVKPLVESHQQFLDQESKVSQDQAKTLVQISVVMQEQTRLLADMQTAHERRCGCCRRSPMH